ncbi:unnamed protein product [Symbiodinium sp. CCMP2456]|nr:unnamed protein product [Symbiodinium sp. CCMP2456]
MQSRAGQLCQEDVDPLAVWNDLPAVSADIQPEMTSIGMSGLTIYGIGKADGLTRLTDTKWLACGSADPHCVAVEMVSGGYLVGDMIRFDGSYWEATAVTMRENMAVMCGEGAGYNHIGCDLITAESRVLTKQDFLKVPSIDPAIYASHKPMMVTLEDGKVFLCYCQRKADGCCAPS